MYGASETRRTPDDPVNPRIASSDRCKHPYLDTERGAPKGDTVPIRVGYCHWVLVDRPNLRWVSIAILDEQRLGRGTGNNSPRGHAEVCPRDCGRDSGAQVREEGGVVVESAVAGQGCDELCAVDSDRRGKDEGGIW